MNQKRSLALIVILMVAREALLAFKKGPENFDNGKLAPGSNGNAVNGVHPQANEVIMDEDLESQFFAHFSLPPEVDVDPYSGVPINQTPQFITMNEDGEFVPFHQLI